MSGGGTQHWKVVSSSNPCPICRVDRGCEVSIGGGWVRCRRVDAGAVRELKSGAGWLHQVGDHHEPLPPVSAPTTGHPKAPPDQLHKVYSTLLHLLPLSPAHHKHLTGPQRQLTPDQIQRRGYRSMPTEGRARLVARLIEKLGGAEELAGVPGFFVSRKGGAAGYWTLAGAEGLLVPMRAPQGRLAGFQIRNMAPQCKKGSRYTWLSSKPDKYPGGTGSGTVPHVARPAERTGARVWVTEGPLKADLSADRLGEVVVALPGVGVRAGLLETLRELGAGEVVVAFDADKRHKPQVLKAEADLLAELKAAGLEVLVADWDETDGKGLDDLLLAGRAPALAPYSGPAAVVAGKRTRKALVIDGGQAVIPAGPYVTVEEAQRRNRELVDLVLRDGGQLILTSGTGTGKTFAVLAALKEKLEGDQFKLGGLRAVVLVDQKVQIARLFEEFPWLAQWQNEGRVVVRQGRDAETCLFYNHTVPGEDKTLGEKMTAYGNKGQNVEAAFCSGCDARTRCAYQLDKIASRRNKAALVIATKQAFVHQPEELKPFDIRVIDEALLGMAYGEDEASNRDVETWLRPERLPADAPARPLLETWQTTLEAFRSVLSEDHHEIPLPPALETLLDREALEAALAAAERQLKAEGGTLPCEEPGGLGPTPLRLIGELVKQLRMELGQPEGDENRTRLWLGWHRETNPDGSAGARWPVIRLAREREELVQILNAKTLLVLDAHPAPETLALFPSAKIEQVQMAPQIRVVQLEDETLPRGTLKNPAKLEKAGRAVAERTAVHPRRLIFCTKANEKALRLIFNREGDTLAIWGRDNRAVNSADYMGVDAVILFGLYAPPINAVRRRVQALRKGPAPAPGPAEAVVPYLGYLDELGRGLGRLMPQDLDPEVQQALEAQTGAEYQQAIGRVRANLRPASDGLVSVYVGTAYPIEGLRVDELVSLRELEGRQNNLEDFNAQRQAGTRDRIERELAAAAVAGETLSQRELAKRAGVSLRDAVNYGSVTNYGIKNIGEVKEVGLSNSLLDGNINGSFQVPVSPELPSPEKTDPDADPVPVVEPEERPATLAAGLEAKLVPMPFCAWLPILKAGWAGPPLHRNGLPAKVAEWPEEWLEAYEERAGIIQFDGGLPRTEAERRAGQMVREAELQGRVPVPAYLRRRQG